MSALFTQKHYEHMASSLCRLRRAPLAERGVTTEELEATVTLLCGVFKRDNPKFKPVMFRQQTLTGIGGTTEEK